MTGIYICYTNRLDLTLTVTCPLTSKLICLLFTLFSPLCDLLPYLVMVSADFNGLVLLKIICHELFTTSMLVKYMLTFLTVYSADMFLWGFIMQVSLEGFRLQQIKIGVHDSVYVALP